MVTFFHTMLFCKYKILEKVLVTRKATVQQMNELNQIKPSKNRTFHLNRKRIKELTALM